MTSKAQEPTFGVLMPSHKLKVSKPVAKVLIVDDHPAIREVLAFRINSESDLEVYGEVPNLTEAIRIAFSHDPDVAVVEISPKSSNTTHLIKRLKEKYENLRIIVWSRHCDDKYAERVLRAGAVGYIDKEREDGKFIEAIRQVLDGKMYLGSAMTEKLIRRQLSSLGGDHGLSPIDSLSDRELEVFRLIGMGVKTSEIAERLHLTVKTIETYRYRIREKLGLEAGTNMFRIASQWMQEHQS